MRVLLDYLKNRLLLNAGKTELLHFKIKSNGNGNLHGKVFEITISYTVKFLGLTVESMLIFEEHCSALRRKLGTGLYDMRCLSGMAD